MSYVWGDCWATYLAMMEGCERGRDLPKSGQSTCHEGDRGARISRDE